MKIIRNIFIFLLILNASLLIIGYFLPSEYTVSRQVTIQRSSSDIFQYAKLVKNQFNYNVWWRLDTNQVTTYSGDDGAIGFKANWTSELESVGSGEQEIMGIQENERLDFRLHFQKPFESNATSSMEFKSIDSLSTQVTWNIDGEMVYPYNALLLFMSMEEVMGSDLQSGLNNLKAILEYRP